MAGGVDMRMMMMMQSDAPNSREESSSSSSLVSRKQWNQVYYSRFLPFPSLPSTSPSLISLPRGRRYRPALAGTWISSSSPSTSVQLITSLSASDALLSVSYNGALLEEHYVSKLVFSWPQVSCIPGYPVRGCRAVFVSYKDSAGEIQKFGLRFSTIMESETFINALRDVLNHPIYTEPPTSDFQSNLSSHSALVSANRLPPRDLVEDPRATTTSLCYSPHVPLSLNCEVEQGLSTKPTQYQTGTSSAMPPSFTSLLASLCPEPKQERVQPSQPKELDIKSQIARYMEDSSFHEMLFKVEQAISEIGGNMLL